MTKRERFEPDTRALGAGCAAMVAGAVLSVAVLMVVVAINGLNVARLRPGHLPESVRWTGYLLRCALCVGVGYVTARRAQRAPAEHAVIMGSVLTLIGLLAFTAPDFWGVIVWLLTVPLTLYGAQLARSRHTG